MCHGSKATNNGCRRLLALGIPHEDYTAALAVVNDRIMPVSVSSGLNVIVKAIDAYT